MGHISGLAEKVLTGVSLRSRWRCARAFFSGMNDEVHLAQLVFFVRRNRAEKTHSLHSTAPPESMCRPYLARHQKTPPAHLTLVDRGQEGRRSTPRKRLRTRTDSVPVCSGTESSCIFPRITPASDNNVSLDGFAMHAYRREREEVSLVCQYCHALWLPPSHECCHIQI